MPSTRRLADALHAPTADRRIAVLRALANSGSIAEAARTVGLGYRAAWQALDTLTTLAGTPLVLRAVGGSGGGGAHLTPAGHALLRTAEALDTARAEALAQLASGNPSAPPRLGLAVRTSMRNQVPAVVYRVRRSGPLADCTLRLSSGAELSARITRASAELLALAPGLAVLVLCKATAVQVHAGGADSAPHGALCGTVERIVRGSMLHEVVLGLAPGLQIVGMATPDARLAKGRPAWGTVDASALVIALAD